MDKMSQQMTQSIADDLMSHGFHCSQCVFPYAAYRLGMDRGEAFRLSAGLGGGCFHGDSCGAVTGAILALGLAYGFDQPDALEEDKRLIARVREFEARFQAAHGACLCRELLGGFDKADPDAQPPEGVYQNCPDYCATACRILDEMLREHYCR